MGDPTQIAARHWSEFLNPQERAEVEEIDRRAREIAAERASLTDRRRRLQARGTKRRDLARYKRAVA